MSGKELVVMLTQLEGFADEFSRLANTPEQRELAGNFDKFVNEGRAAAEHGHVTLAGLFKEMREEAAARMQPEQEIPRDIGKER